MSVGVFRHFIWRSCCLKPFQSIQNKLHNIPHHLTPSSLFSSPQLLFFLLFFTSSSFPHNLPLLLFPFLLLLSSFSSVSSSSSEARSPSFPLPPHFHLWFILSSSFFTFFFLSTLSSSPLHLLPLSSPLSFLLYLLFYLLLGLHLPSFFIFWCPFSFFSFTTPFSPLVHPLCSSPSSSSLHLLPLPSSSLFFLHIFISFTSSGLLPMILLFALLLLQIQNRWCLSAHENHTLSRW